MWQWANYLEVQVPDGKNALRLNLDETPVNQFVGHQCGNVFYSKKRRGERGQEPVQRIARGKTRAALTHVASVCDDPTIQPDLLQILVTNGHVVRRRDVSTIVENLPPKIALWREKSSWTNVDIICHIRAFSDIRIR